MFQPLFQSLLKAFFKTFFKPLFQPLFKAFLSAEGENPYSSGHFETVVFDERHEIQVFAPLAGTVQVHWLLEERSENSLTTSGLPLETPMLIQVLDIAGEQTFDLELPAEALEALLKGW